METTMDARVKRVKTGGAGALATVAWRNVGRNRRRTALSVTAVGIAVFFNIFMTSWMDGMFKSIGEVVRVFDSGDVSAVSARYDQDREYYPVQYPLADTRDGAALLAAAAAIPGVEAALPRITAYATLFDSTVKHAVLWGLDIEAETAAHPMNITKRGDGLLEGRFPEPGKNECAVGAAFAKKAGLRIGDRIPLKTVSAEFSDKFWSPEVTGIFSFDYRNADESYILADVNRLSRVLGMDGGIQQLALFLDRPSEASRVRSELRGVLAAVPGSPGDDVVREWADNYWVAMWSSMTFLFVAVFLVFQIVASFLIINTILMVIHERIKEIGMMGALGMTRAEIVGVFFLEAVFLSVLGSLAGAAVGALVSWLGSLYPFDVNAIMGGGMKDLPMAGTLYTDFSLRSVAEGFAFGVLVSSACTLFPSLKSAFIEPVEALRR